MEYTRPPERPAPGRTGEPDGPAGLPARPGRGSAARLAADALRDLITAGRLAPGSRLPEKALGSRLEVSRNTLREAFRVLGQERLVVHRLNRGVFVRTLTADDVADIYTVRRALEAAGVRSVPRPGGLAAVAAAVRDGEDAAARGEWTAVADADLRFHRALGALGGSPRIDGFLGGLLGELRLAFAVVPDRPPFHSGFLRRNRAIADLLAVGERGRAEQELVGYLDDAEVMIIDFLRKGQP